MNEDQKAGRKFEDEWAKLFGGKVTPGSGNTVWAKLDVGDGTILWSLKSTQFKSFPLSIEVMREVVSECRKVGGSGSVLPGLGIRLDHRGLDEPVDLVVMRRDDFLHLVTSGEAYVRPSKSEMKKRTARTPILLREQGEE